MVTAAKYVLPAPPEPEIIYPDSDDEPMAENTIQYRYIITIQPGLDSLFADDPNVFVAADLFWYPVEGRPDIHYAPDTMVVFGRPKGDRGSYKQWEEDGIAPQVVFEIISPGNTWRKLVEKRSFYERYGVEEYYEYDPEQGVLGIWQRNEERLQPTAHAGEWRSRRLGVTLKLEENGELSLYHPDGRKFLTPVEQEARAREAEAKAREAEAKTREAEAKAREAEETAMQERTRADQTEQINQRLLSKLRELGVDPATLGE
ncbi:MAG TPA: Uma2 family endonuclease [Blastocatellia bacterium]|nr:Uma2 family endonuclease [Blastocatellia bacterium]HMV85509.1 Uma2 family endonuclease [Blastocatellia bacterium]HMX28392.1 Uma2 family endonuclease [Blastocatellia bacterium]HMY70321.1 Uma2 family endonuclease [Blastocatellia bacterium]HMZ19980.1 Uma2 family endonuclease [Blastocatellia bacterium]